MRLPAIFALLALTACSPMPAVPPASMPAVAVDPTVLARGPIVQDAISTHVALDGDAFFVLSQSATPTSLADLRFTRDGAFHMEFERGEMEGTGAWHLVNADGLRVMAWSSTVDPAVRPFGTPPEEQQGLDFGAFATVVTNGQDKAPLAPTFAPLTLDLVANPDAANNTSFDFQGLLRVNGGAPRDPQSRESNIHVALVRPATPTALRHEGGGYLAWDPAAGTLFTGTAGNEAPGRVVGKAVTVRPQSRERLPLLTPSRYDRARYPDALDPRTALPEGTPAIAGAMVTAVVPEPDRSKPASLTVHMVALADGAATDRRWTVRVAPDTTPVQRRAGILRPVPRAALTRGAIADVWLDAAGAAQAVVVVRDDRPGEVLDALGTGWY